MIIRNRSQVGGIMSHHKSFCVSRFSAAPLATLLFLAAHSLVAQSLQITSPADGTTVNPGQSLTVTVTASGTFQSVVVAAGGPIGFSQSLSVAPFQFTLQVPTGIQPGLYPLGAMGFTSPGSPAFSNPITLDVERADAPVSLSVQPSLLHFFTVGPAGRVHVLGTFADGTTTNLTNSSLTSYSSFGTVTAGSYGVVTAAASGGDVLQVAYGGLSASIPVTVDFPLNIAPGQKILYASQTQQFTAQPAGVATPTIVWSLSPTGVGSIASTGQYTAVYTAPSSITTQQAVTVTAVNAADNTLSSSATVILNLPVLINVVPSTVSLGPSQTQGFGAIVLNAPFTDVIWNLPSGSPGTLDQYGHYTAPSSVTSPQTVTIQAISAMDGVTIGSSAVTLTGPPGPPPAVISWSNPAAIAFGSALSSEQLNATANTPGAFVYNPPAGTVPLVGNGQALSVQFTPADTTDFSGASASVNINVTPSSPAGLIGTYILSRDVNNNVVATLTLANTGTSAATNVQLTSATIGSVVTTTPLPQAIANIPAGGVQSTTVLFAAASVGASGSRAVISCQGSYTGENFGASARVVLP
jgi:hypothetical protein